jgi:hypothetical protein
MQQVERDLTSFGIIIDCSFEQFLKVLFGRV